MDCRDIQKMLSAYLDGLLSADDKETVDRHLSSCVNCRESFEELEKARALLRDLKTLEPPPWLGIKIMAQVREEAARKESLLTRLFSAFPSRAPLQALGVVVLAVLAFQVYRMLVPEMTGMREMPRPSSQVQKETKETINAVVPGKAGKEEAPADALAPAPASSSLNKQYAAEASKDKRVEDEVERERAEAPVSSPAAGPGSAGRGAQGGQSDTLEPSPRQEGQHTALRQDRRVEAPTQEARQDVAAGLTEQRSQAVAAGRAGAEKAVAAGVAQEALPTILVRTRDSAAARQVVEETVSELGGKTIETSAQEGRILLVVELAAARLSDLAENMKSLGEVTTTPQAAAEAEAPLRVRIEIEQLSVAR